MKKNLTAIAAVAVMGLCSAGAQAASVLTFNSVDAPTDAASWTLSCTACDMLAFLDNDGDAYDPYPTYSLAGSLGGVGSAFTRTGGPTASRNPNISGAALEEAFITAVASAQGETVIGGSFQKTESTSNINTGPGSPTDAGDYFLWKAGQYAGVAKLLSIQAGNMFSFSGTHGLSHVSHISTETTPVPLPAAGWMLLAGIGGLAAWRRKKA